MRQVNIRLTDEEYDALVRECPPAATVSGLATVILRQHLNRGAEYTVEGRSVSSAEFARAAAKPGDWRPFSKEDQTGRKRR